MARRDGRHGRVRPAAEDGRFRSWLALLVVLALAAGVAATYRYDLADRWFPRDPAGPVDPSTVEPPPGLDLPPITEPAPLATPVAVDTPIDKAAVRAALAPYLRDDDLGGHVLAAVGGLAGGPTYTFGRGTAVPASTTKLLTGLATLATLDPAQTFATRVVREGRRVVLVGGGDPLLASSPPDADRKPGERAAWPARADLTTLAQQTAQTLLAEGVTSVRLRYDDSLFTGPAVNPHWPASYLPEGVVAPISALWADQGRPEEGTGRVADPPRAAAEVFARELAKAGVAVAGRPAARPAGAGAEQVAEVRSAPVAQLVEHALLVSDNETTEVLMRQLALASGAEGSSGEGTRVVLEVLARLGVPTDRVRLRDGSGLSRQNLIPPATLLGVLRQAATGAPALRTVLTGLPVAGFSGSLSSRFASGPTEGRGRVRAKTGTLTGVSSLAGIATTVAGTPLLFVLMSDRVAPADTLDAREDLDAAASALAACACA
ncbi:D-alanyl-D-alanine carboxypeptidase/D-alanyl-D-alanine-endopeptidase [Nocardioides sp. W7]|uniref:D-alanyl-D-alanine carboxypeptidase/D-alanyl-D-alanine endopeptidase n=1 Tax=Nocardioides sp. W7 TaxID=2931390 RepID=UPI001FD09291|nr:D-alanyl-D-alanine carboxypeptidase/D-alanyl-D-alanine-endopeptidase [Nocardioides sp. W7]